MTTRETGRSAGQKSIGETISPDQTLPKLIEYLGTPKWMRDSYKSYLLTLSPKEKDLLRRDDHITPYREDDEVKSTIAVARAKQELQDVAECDIAELSEIAQSYLLLNSLFDNRWQRRGSRSLIVLGLDKIVARTSFYDSELPVYWRGAPNLLYTDQAVVEPRLAHFDNRYSIKWRSQAPVLAGSIPETIHRKEESYDKGFGPEWKIQLGLLMNSPEKTVFPSVRALESIGITLKNTPPSTYFELLKTSVALKRKKARLIRTHELGHKYVFVHEQKRPLGENVNRRAKLTPEEKQKEAEEIREFAIFIRSNPRQFAKSATSIRATLHETLARQMGPKTQEQIKVLVQNAQEGNSEAFGDLVRVTQKDVYTLAYRLTGNEDDARDVAQEAYLRAFRNLKKFRGESKFSTWMYRITANCASTYFTRFGRRHDELNQDEHIPDERPESDPHARAEATALRDRVTAALADLPPILRAVVVLRDVYDLPHDAIAEELGITESAAKVRLHRARRKLRERLFPMPGEEGPRNV